MPSWLSTHTGLAIQKRRYCIRSSPNSWRPSSPDNRHGTARSRVSWKNVELNIFPQIAEPRGRVPAGERETFPDGPRSSDTAASLPDSVGGTHFCHSIPIEHRGD